MAGLLDRAMEWIANHAWKGYGTKVSGLGARTSSNPYTFPSDGMLWLESNYRANSYIIAFVDGIKVAQPSTPSSGSAGNFSISIPVFKGQKAYFERANTYCYAEFIPYKNMGGGYCLTLIPAERRWRHERATGSHFKLYRECPSYRRARHKRYLDLQEMVGRHGGVLGQDYSKQVVWSVGQHLLRGLVACKLPDRIVYRYPDYNGRVPFRRERLFGTLRDQLLENLDGRRYRSSWYERERKLHLYEVILRGRQVEVTPERGWAA